ncbi:hypothetical protein GWK47_013009 [Chionoecetes opilio]|uniref:CHK kinase-like domain-containing protein n=1 Tax=Chionoecetes opilio TaxID=41210 RepID=A0A8J4Y0Y1_CHIOP|nr:hypothetical protein GWK47_013009 [Chionoecetes opilio]
MLASGFTGLTDKIGRITNHGIAGPQTPPVSHPLTESLSMTVSLSFSEEGGPMNIPKSGREISSKWAEYILRAHMAVAGTPAFLQVDNCTVSEDLGDGYNSQVVFFSVDTTEREETSSPDVKKTYHLVAKLLKENPQFKVLNKKFKIGLKEYLVYTDLISNLNNILSVKAPEVPQISLPKLIYGKCTSNEFALVMENLQHAGYEMNDKRKGFDAEQLMAAVKRIAIVHAVSSVFLQTADTSKYSCFPTAQEYMNTLNIMMGVSLEISIEFLKSSKENEELGKKIESCKSSLLEKASAALLSDYPVKCLAHGDLWNNNIMLKYSDAPDEQKIIEEVKIIDWGNTSWGPPIFDLQYLVHTSTNRAVRKENLDEVLSHYHSTFMTLTTQLGYPPGKWDLSDFKAEWEKSYPLGFLLGCCLTAGTLSTTNPANKKPEPSILDKPLLLPLKVLVNGMKLGMFKVLMPVFMSSGGKKLFAGLLRKLLQPTLEELKSGKNEAMNTRLLELLYEADENGLL